MVCTQCGQALPEDAVFCKACGQKLKVTTNVGVSSAHETSFDSQEMSSSNSSIRQAAFHQLKLGHTIAAGGSTLSLLAFFLIPYYIVFTRAMTAPQLAGDQLGSQISSGGLLWLEPIIAGSILLLAIVQLFKAEISDSTPSTVGMLILAGLTLLVLLIKFAIDAQPQTSNTLFGSITQPAISSFYAAGSWIYITGMIVVIVGAIVQMRSEW